MLLMLCVEVVNWLVVDYVVAKWRSVLVLWMWPRWWCACAKWLAWVFCLGASVWLPNGLRVLLVLVRMCVVVKWLACAFCFCANVCGCQMACV